MQNKIEVLRDLHLTTDLGNATIAAPASGEHDDVAFAIAKAVQSRGGVVPPVVTEAEADLEGVLAGSHAIVPGNLATSPFVRTLYLKWMTLVDRWYPGKGGRVLRTVHDPFGTGYNVVLAGGSDADGVHEATRLLCRKIREEGLLLGRLHDVKLGEGHEPLPDRIAAWGTISSHTDGGHGVPRPSDCESGYDGGPVEDYLLKKAFYGPNADLGQFTVPSQLGLRYWYTGRGEHGRAYRDSLLGDIGSGVLKGTYHYKSLRMFQVWVQMAPSPVFSDEDRLEIDNALLGYVLNSSGVSQADRIAQAIELGGPFNRPLACDVLNLLVGGLYFSRRYPDPRWGRYLELADRYFQSYLGIAEPITGITEGYYTYLEVMLDYALLRMPDEYVRSEAFGRWCEKVLALCDNFGLILPDGSQSGCTRHPYHLLRKIAFLRGDGRYLHAAEMRERVVVQGIDSLSSFHGGQAYAGDVKPAEPMDATGLRVLPLSVPYRQCAAPDVSQARAFDKVVARERFSTGGSYLVLNGVRGLSKYVPSVSSLVEFDAFDCAFVTASQQQLQPEDNNPTRHSVVTVSKDGRAGAEIAGATLDEHWSGSLSYSATTVAEPGSYTWTRHLFWQGAMLFVIDAVEAHDSGGYRVAAHWRLAGEAHVDGANARFTHRGRATMHVQTVEPLRFIHEDAPIRPLTGRTNDATSFRYTRTGAERITMLHALADRPCEAGDRVLLPTLMHAVTPDGEPAKQLAETDGIYCVGSAFVAAARGTASWRLGDAVLMGKAFWLEEAAVLLVRASSLSAGDTSLTLSEETTLDWCLRTGVMRVRADRAVTLSLRGDFAESIRLNGKPAYLVSDNGERTLHLHAGDWQIDGLRSRSVRGAIRNAGSRKPTGSPAPRAAAPAPSIETISLWELSAPEEVTLCDVNEETGQCALGFSDGRLRILDGAGRTERGLDIAAAPSAIAWIGTHLFVGDREGGLACIDEDDRLLWRHQHTFTEDAKFYHWWTMERPLVSVLWTGRPTRQGDPIVVAGTGSTSLTGFTMEGELLFERTVGWGLPTFLIPRRTNRGEIVLLVAHRDLTPSSAVHMVRPTDGSSLGMYGHPAPNEGLRLETGSGWDMSGAVSVLMAEPDRGQVAVLRRGTFNHLSLYDSDSADPQWSVRLGGMPAAACRGAVEGVPVIHTADRLGDVCAFDWDGNQLSLCTVSHRIELMASTRDGDAVCVGGGCASLVRHSRIHSFGGYSGSGLLLLAVGEGELVLLTRNREKVVAVQLRGAAHA